MQCPNCGNNDPEYFAEMGSRQKKGHYFPVTSQKFKCLRCGFVDRSGHAEIPK